MRLIALSALILLGGTLSGTVLATSPPAASPTEWKKWYDGWVRLEADGNLSCLSFNGTHCSWNRPVSEPGKVPASELQPLVCGTAHAAKWGNRTGYNDANNLSGDRHWCRSAYATYFAKWQDYSILGARHWLSETPAGDAMCHSTDGKTCTLVLPGESQPPSGDVHPVVCGAHHRRIDREQELERQPDFTGKGKEGYDTPGHWCATPKIDEDFGKQQATADWTQIEAKGWAHFIEPAMLMRVRVPQGRSLILRTEALLEKPVVFQQQELSKAFFGLEFGKQLRFHLGDTHVEAPPSWKALDPSSDEVIVAATVTPEGNACFFSGKSGDRFFADANLIGDTRQILDDAQQPVRFTASSAEAVAMLMGGKPMTAVGPVDWRADTGADFAIDKVLMLYARFVPVEGDITGKKRPIYYAADCDQR
ncbi:hypothetical protein [Roseateles sp.]|uniref:hypothetical protein n=1 Tax=Roseateles sp. TaxID=1971397 RepID=UPI002F3EE8BB